MENFIFSAIESSHSTASAIQSTGQELSSLISFIPLIFLGVIIWFLVCLIKKESQRYFFNQIDENFNSKLNKIILIFFVSMFFACSKEDGGTDADSNNAIISSYIDSNGGEILVSDDYPLIAGTKLNIPPGALDNNINISIKSQSINTDLLTPVKAVQDDGSLFLSLADQSLKGTDNVQIHPMYGPLLTLKSTEFHSTGIQFEPEGTVFNLPVTVTIPFDVFDLSPEDTDFIPLIQSANGTWEVLQNFEIDSENALIRIEVNHFSLLQVIKRATTLLPEMIWNYSEISSAIGSLPQNSIQQFIDASICGQEQDLKVEGVDGQDIPGLYNILEELYLGSYPGTTSAKMEKLKSWIISHDGNVPDNSITFAQLYGKALKIADGNVFVALGTVNGVLSSDRRDENKYPDNYLNKLVVKFRGDGVDESGARYHFFGTALYAFALEHVKAQSTILTLDNYFNNDILGNLISSETISTIEEGIVSGDLISDPTEYAVDLKGAELGRHLYQELMGSTRDELLEKYNIDINNCYDYSYSYDKPGTVEALKHVVSMTNIDVGEEGDFTYWQMNKGGVKDGRNLGTVVFKFDFNQVIAEAKLVAYIHTFTWSYGKGYGYLYASKDGTNWEQLTEVTAPAYSEYNFDPYAKMIPESLMGAKQLWIKVELLTYRKDADGSFIDSGSNKSNLSQFSRYRTGDFSPTFKLNVNFY